MAKLVLGAAELAIVPGSYATVRSSIPQQTLLKTPQPHAKPLQGSKQAHASEEQEGPDGSLAGRAGWNLCLFRCDWAPFLSCPQKAPAHSCRSLCIVSTRVWGAANLLLSTGGFLKDALCTVTGEGVVGNLPFLINLWRVRYHFGNILSHEGGWVALLFLSCLQWQKKIPS